MDDYQQPTTDLPPTDGALGIDEEPDEDVEGHFVGRAVAGSGLLGGKQPSRAHQATQDEELKPLTKRFPSMREDDSKK